MPSHNKRDYIPQGIRAVYEQTDPRWELHVLENSTDGETRQSVHDIHDLMISQDPRIKIWHFDLSVEERAEKDVPVYLCNLSYPMATGDLIVYISDDDLISPGLTEMIIRKMDENPDWDAMYWNALVAHVHSFKDEVDARPWLSAAIDRGPGQLDCQVDGGSIAVRKSAFERLEKPWYPEDLSLGQNSHSDGVLMEKLANSGVVFHAVDYNGLVHRRTPISVYTKA